MDTNQDLQEEAKILKSENEKLSTFKKWFYLSLSFLPWLVVAKIMQFSDIFPDLITIITIPIGAISTYRGLRLTRSFWRALFCLLSVPYILILAMGPLVFLRILTR